MNKNHTVLITGASSGIGEAMVRELASNGHRVIMLARSKDKMQKIAASLPAGSCHIYPCDLTDHEQAGNIYQKILTEYPDLSAAVHNAGSAAFGRPDEIAVDDWLSVMDLNLNAGFVMAHALLPHFAGQGRGHFIFVNSVAAHDIFSGGSLYGSSKAALKSFADHLREECRPLRIPVSTISPGATATPWWEGSGMDTSDMTPAENIARLILTLLQQPDTAVIEDITIRRVEGNF